MLDVVIVSYRCEALLRDCLESLREHPASCPTRVHVVDNASGDSTAERARERFPEVALTAASGNLGFGAASNIAIRASSGEHVLLLNPDTRVTAGALDTLVARLESDPRIGMCGPRLELEDGGTDHAAKRSFPTPLSALGHFSGLGRRDGARGRLAAYTAPAVESGPVDAINGACMLVRRAALDQVGLFDEAYWMYMEDLDLCYRFAQAGWVTFYEPAATVIHVKAGTSGAVRSVRLTYAFHRGMLRFYRDHYAARRSAPVNAAIYAGIATKLVAATLRSVYRRYVPRPTRSR